MARRMFKKAVQQGRSERKAEAYSVRYVEALSEARTLHGKRRVSAHRGWVGEKIDFFNILLETNCPGPKRDSVSRNQGNRS